MVPLSNGLRGPFSFKPLHAWYLVRDNWYLPPSPVLEFLIATRILGLSRPIVRLEGVTLCGMKQAISCAYRPEELPFVFLRAYECSVAHRAPPASVSCCGITGVSQSLCSVLDYRKIKSALDFPF